KESYATYFRPWLLRVACEKLKALSPRFSDVKAAAGASPSPDSTDVPRKLEHYFHRLSTEEQILLLFRDKYGLPYTEISNATGLPEESIKVRRQQALRALEEWVWEDAI